MRQEERGVGSGDGEKKTKMKLLGGQTEHIVHNSLLSSTAGRHMHSGRTYHVPYDMKETVIFFLLLCITDLDIKIYYIKLNIIIVLCTLCRLIFSIYYIVIRIYLSK